MRLRTSRRFPSLVVIFVLATCVRAAASGQEVSATQAQAESVDRYGDPIPYGAAVRLGTERFRVLPGGSWASGVVFSEDAKTLASITATGPRWFDSETGEIQQDPYLGRFIVRAFAASPVGHTFAIMGTRSVGVTQIPGHVIQIWDVAAAKRIDEFLWEEDYGCRAMAYTPDAKHLVLGNGSGMLSVWDIERRDWAVDHQLPERRRIEAIAVSPDGKRIAAATSQSLFVWNWLRGVETEIVEGFRRVTALSFADEHNLAVARHRFDDGPGLVMLDLDRRDVTRQFTPPEMRSLRATQLLFSPDRRFLAVPNSRNVGSPKDNAVLVWNVETGALAKRLPLENARPFGVAFSPDQRLIAAISRSEIGVWDFESGRRLASELVGHQAIATSVHFTQHDSQIVTAGDDGTARLWQADTGQLLGVLRHEHWVRGMAASSDGKWIATSSLDNSVRLWNRDTREDVYILPGHGVHGGHRTIAFTSDSSRFASWGDDMWLRVWDVKTGDRLLEKLIQPGGEILLDDEGMSKINYCVMAPGASKLLISDLQNTYLFDAETGQEVKTIPTNRPFEAACFSSDATQLLLGREASDPTQAEFRGDRSQQLLPEQSEFLMMNIEDDSINWTFRAQGRVGQMVLSPDGNLVALTARGSECDALFFLDARTGNQLAAIERIDRIGWGRDGQKLAFSSDGRLFAACMCDTTVLVWQLSDLGF